MTADMFNGNLTKNFHLILGVYYAALVTFVRAVNRTPLNDSCPPLHIIQFFSHFERSSLCSVLLMPNTIQPIISGKVDLLTINTFVKDGVLCDVWILVIVEIYYVNKGRPRG